MIALAVSANNEYEELIDAEANEVDISIFNSHDDVYAYEADTENKAWEAVSAFEAVNETFNAYDDVNEHEELMDSDANEELVLDNGVPSIFSTLI